jgi:hypothetical protein
MMIALIHVLRTAFTGADNRSADIGRMLWATMVAWFCALSAWHVYHAGTFDPQAWAIGAASLLAGGGAALGLKAGAEPPT